MADATAVDEFVADNVALLPITGCSQSEAAGGQEYCVYFEPGDYPADLPTILRQQALEAGLTSISIREPVSIPRENWHDNWREYFKPVDISPSICIRPSWEKQTHGGIGSRINIFIEPGMAFGTGTHATTKLCLRLAENYVLEGDLALDVGTGSGILIIAAAKLGARFAAGFDIDPDILENVAHNLRLNDIGQGRAGAFVGTLAAVRERPFDLVFCNMLSHQFLPELAALRRLCVRGSRVLLSGFLTTEKPEIHRAVAEAGFSVIDTDSLEEWTAFVLSPVTDGAEVKPMKSGTEIET